jgi:NAD-dependent dihydropyrimidine dehydrogenase PreA subunit
MLIDEATCNGCGDCLPYCPVEAISLREESFVDEKCRLAAVIDRDECVDCSACLRASVCPPHAIRAEQLGWPRIIRQAFSDPLYVHGTTGVPGRGTEEVKTNDVTGLYRNGFFGVGLEFGRPGLGTRFRDIEKATVTLARLGIPLVADNPLSELLEDPSAGRFRDDILDEKVLSAIVQCIVPDSRLREFVDALSTIAGQIDTVFSLALICRAGRDGRLPLLNALEAAGLPLSPNGKVNVGLGRPLLADEWVREGV